jgi:hypothetical protein
MSPSPRVSESFAHLAKRVTHSAAQKKAHPRGATKPLRSRPDWRGFQVVHDRDDKCAIRGRAETAELIINPDKIFDP